MKTRTRPRKRTVLFLEHNVDRTVGGSHHCLLDICRNLDQTLFKPLVVFLQDNALVDEFRLAGLEVVIGSPAMPLMSLSSTDAHDTSRLRTFIQTAINAFRVLLVRPLQWMLLLRRKKVDIVYLNNTFNGNHDLMIASWALRLPCVAHQRGVPGFTGPSEVWFGRRLSKIVAISSFIRDDLLARGLPSSQVELIYDGIDPTRLVPTKSAESTASILGLDIERPMVGMIGNIKRWKGQHVFIDAMAAITRRHPDVCGVLVGAVSDPGYFDELKAAICRHRLESNIVFVGYQRYPADVIVLMDIVVHASVDPEPFGVVITEAMALGKPVIASKLGGPVDIIVDGLTGFLTPTNDSAALAESVIRLLDDPNLARQVGIAARRSVHDHFTAARNVAKLQKLLLALTAG